MDSSLKLNALLTLEPSRVSGMTTSSQTIQTPKLPPRTQPLSGESLSSWLYRIHLKIPKTVGRSRLAASSFSLDWEYDHEYDPDKRFEDPDHVAGNRWITDVARHLEIPTQWFEQQFGFFEQPYIPGRYRRAFCYECMAEGTQIAGHPVCNLEWRHLMQPFCVKHGALLHDAPVAFAMEPDYSMQLFRWYWDSRGAREYHQLMCKAWPRRLKLAFDVQQRFALLRMQEQTSLGRANIDGFMLSLMRAVLMPALHFCYAKVMFSSWGGANGYIKGAFYSQLYHEVYRASCSARARALYLSGILLGWITEEQAFSTNREDFFTARHCGQIWGAMDNHANLLTWLRTQLRMFETKDLNISMLADVPVRWTI